MPKRRDYWVCLTCTKNMIWSVICILSTQYKKMISHVAFWSLWLWIFIITPHFMAINFVRIQEPIQPASLSFNTAAGILWLLSNCTKLLKPHNTRTTKNTNFSCQYAHILSWSKQLLPAKSLQSASMFHANS